MARKKSKDQVREHFYGIDPKTFEVASVSWSGETLTRSWPSLQMYSHVIHPSNKNNPAKEIRIVWGLTDIFSVHPLFEDKDHTKKKLEELEAKAAEMKKAAEEAKV